MRSYLIYVLLLIIILVALIDSMGNINKTIMYGIAIVSIISLIIMKSKERNKK